jgi:hypothetical protein
MLSFQRVVTVIVSVQSNRTVTKIEVGTRDWDSPVKGLTMQLVGGMLALGVWIRKALQCFRSSQSAELDSFGHMVPELESRIQERSYGIYLHS